MSSRATSSGGRTSSFPLPSGWRNIGGRPIDSARSDRATFLEGMSLKIDQDHSRFRHIVRGRIRQNLRKYISQGELIGRKGKDLVSIPIPHIEIPRFRYGDKQTGGAGQGDGEPGDPMGGEEQEGDGGKKAGE